MKKEIIEKIMNSNCGYIGIRHLADDEVYKIGDICRNSYDWDYENDCSSYGTDNEIELDGTCTVDTKIELEWDDMEEIEKKLEYAIELSEQYDGVIAIIGGNRIDYGADDNEIIIENATVIDLI